MNLSAAIRLTAAAAAAGLKPQKFGNSLLVLWLGLCGFTAKSLSSILGQGAKILQATRHGQYRKGKKTIIIKQDSLSPTVTQKCLRCLHLEHGARMACISPSADSTRFTFRRRNTSPLLFDISQIAKKNIIFSGSHWHN